MATAKNSRTTAQKNSTTPSESQTDSKPETPETPETVETPETETVETETPSTSGVTAESLQETPEQNQPDSEDTNQVKASSPSDENGTEVAAKDADADTPAVVVKEARVGVPAGRILVLDAPLTFEAEIIGTQAIVKEDVYREHTARGSNRKTYTLVYAKGAVIPASKIQRA